MYVFSVYQENSIKNTSGHSNSAGHSTVKTLLLIHINYRRCLKSPLRDPAVAFSKRSLRKCRINLQSTTELSTQGLEIHNYYNIIQAPTVNVNRAPSFIEGSYCVDNTEAFKIV